MSAPRLLDTIYSNEADLPAQVQAFIARGADVSAVTEYCESPLRVASNNGRFDVVWLLLEAGADATQLAWTPSFYQLVYGTVEEMEASLYEHGDIEARDYWERTPLLMAIQLGDIAKAACLLGLGADRSAIGRCGKPPFFYAIKHNNTAMMAWLLEQGFDIEATNSFGDTPLHFAAELGMTESVRFLLEQGVDIERENHIPYKPIEVASNLEIVRLLVERGAELNEIDEEMHAALIGAALHEDPDCSRQDYLAGKRRQFGARNGERHTPPFWRAMIVAGADSWAARSKFDNTNAFKDEPVWCYKRFGRTTTLLDDGRIIEIAGEHEDSYDPDFCIYNDVVCFGRDGGFDIYNYPAEVFPPTDFHSATLVDDRIYIIGNLGYGDDRRIGATPVFALHVGSMKIERIETTGELPGWISRHKARLLDGQWIEITGGKVWSDAGNGPELLENTGRYRLDLRALTWERLQDR